MTPLSEPVESIETIAAPRLPISPRRWWQCLFEQSEDAHLVCLHDGKVVKANEKAMQWLGLSASAITR